MVTQRPAKRLMVEIDKCGGHPCVKVKDTGYIDYFILRYGKVV